MGSCLCWAFVLTSVFVVATQPTYAGLKAHYRFDGDLNDAAGKHHARPVDPKVAPTFELGRCGDALLIERANAGIEVTSPEAIDFSRDFTIAAWVNTRLASCPYERTILFKGHREGFTHPDKHLSLFGDKGILLYAGGQGGWGTSFAATHKIEVNDGEWHFVAVSYDADKEPHLAFYVDGHRKHPVDDGTFMGGDFRMRPDAANSVLRIGCRADNEGPYFCGSLDELQIYDHALTPEDVQFLSTHPGSDSDSRRIVRPRPRMRIDPGHPWRPPFGVERIGQPLTVLVQFACDERPVPEHWLASYQDGEEVERKLLSVTGTSPFTVKVDLDTPCDELALFSKDGQDKPVELARWRVERPEFEAEAEAFSEPVINPVDLCTILPPADWLILSPKQKGRVRVAAFSTKQDIPGAQAAAWFESSPQRRTAASIELRENTRAETSLTLPEASFTRDRDSVHVAIVGEDGREIWQKRIPAMLVSGPPRWPSFGATETQLRYDAPISVRAEDGTLSSMDYADGWRSELNDVVVSLPNGSRFVFWRGSSYVPFWAGRYNTGLCYEWAETSPPPDGHDCVEPLMDKELRYGRVAVVESTPARVHVRWSYQSCDFHYRVWGDSAVEDFYFYPDGFGTRVLTLTSAPDGDYELSELIILTPQATYPLRVLPANLVDLLFLDGRKRELDFPFPETERDLEKLFSGDMPAVYRVRLNDRETSAAIYFNPDDPHLPLVFAPFFSGRELVTPVYWGCHWPLARGRTTGWAIDERVGLTPAHNSIMSWGRRRPAPLEKKLVDTVDTLGRARRMLVERWAWLIGMSDDSDARLLERARSYAQPPDVSVTGGVYEGWEADRRAHRIAVAESTVTIRIEPRVPCVNPVFEMANVNDKLSAVALDGRPLRRRDYAWDGETLWLDADITCPTTLQLTFESP
jgi:hypothetical protein